jgi:hypothetical protein
MEGTRTLTGYPYEYKYIYNSCRCGELSRLGAKSAQRAEDRGIGDQGR